MFRPHHKVTVFMSSWAVKLRGAVKKPPSWPLPGCIPLPFPRSLQDLCLCKQNYRTHGSNSVDFRTAEDYSMSTKKLLKLEGNQRFLIWSNRTLVWFSLLVQFVWVDPNKTVTLGYGSEQLRRSLIAVFHHISSGSWTSTKILVTLLLSKQFFSNHFWAEPLSSRIRHQQREAPQYTTTCRIW